MAGPLDGYRVIDLTTMIAGPLATMMLADQGADVIKVEPPVAGDHVRGAGHGGTGLTATFLNNNRNKRSISLDLKTEQGRDALLRLAATADVFVQNFRPGVVERLKIAVEDIREVAPQIIYVSMSGFGERGPWAHKPVYDPIVQALSGLTTIQAGSDEAQPRLVRTILPDKLTGVKGAQAITAALLARAKSGEGQHVRLSMLDAIIAFLWSSDMGGQTFVGKEVSAQRAATFIDLIYATKDGYISVATMANKQWQGLCNATEHPEWLDDERFRTASLRDQNADARLRLVQSALLEKTADEWLEILEEAGVPCAPVLKRMEMIRHPQVEASEIIIETEHPNVGNLRQARPAARFEGTPTEIRRGAPLLGEHTDEILTELGMSNGEIASLREQGVINTIN
ncbi:MAG: CoA transferase [Pseudomonadales bacterium]|jgi:crotonobetainyl-CoA:carnitine CoA-transferase CaiB-like acyl-CoA transferase|nr:CoA transferase [Pseudomonadales bacterium]